MTRTQRAGWVMLAVTVALTLVGVGVYAVTEINMLREMSFIITPIGMSAVGLLTYGYRDLVTRRRETD